MDTLSGAYKKSWIPVSTPTRKGLGNPDVRFSNRGAFSI